MTFRELSELDLKSAMILYENGLYNNALRIGQQVLEKIFKSCILNVDGSIDETTLKTHHLPDLYYTVCLILKISIDKNKERVLKRISCLYINTNYPGPRFTLIDKTEAKVLLESIINFRCEFSKYTEKL